jgi:hypothetical protein
MVNGTLEWSPWVITERWVAWDRHKTGIWHGPSIHRDCPPLPEVDMEWDLQVVPRGVDAPYEIETC